MLFVFKHYTKLNDGTRSTMTINTLVEARDRDEAIALFYRRSGIHTLTDMGYVEELDVITPLDEVYPHKEDYLFIMKPFSKSPPEYMIIRDAPSSDAAWPQAKGLVSESALNSGGEWNTVPMSTITVSNYVHPKTP